MSAKVGSRPRLMIDVTPDLRRRIKVAAARQDQSVRDYVVGILEQAVPALSGDDTHEASPAGTGQGYVSREVVEYLQRLQAAQGVALSGDSADLLQEARAGRAADLERAIGQP